MIYNTLVHVLACVCAVVKTAHNTQYLYQIQLHTHLENESYDIHCLHVHLINAYVCVCAAQ